MLKVNEKTRELFVYGQIGPADWGFIGGDSIVEALGVLGDGPINVRLNSPGGSVDEATAAVENLRRHSGEVTVSIDALAASAATLLLVSGFKVTAAPRAMVMIHEPHTIAIGDAASALGPQLAALEVNPLRVSGSEIEALDALAIWTD